MRSGYMKLIIIILLSSVLLLSRISMAATLTYTYDNLNRLTKVIYGDGTTEEFTYDDAGNRLSHILKVFDITPPTPNPMTWLTSPYAASATSISMVATTATDAENPPVYYYFNEVTGVLGGSDSGWQSSNTYTNTGLWANMQYGYRVKARDSASPANETGYSQTVYSYTFANAPGPLPFTNVTQTCI